MDGFRASIFFEDTVRFWKPIPSKTAKNQAHDPHLWTLKVQFADWRYNLIKHDLWKNHTRTPLKKLSPESPTSEMSTETSVLQCLSFPDPTPTGSLCLKILRIVERTTHLAASWLLLVDAFRRPKDDVRSLHRKQLPTSYLHQLQKWHVWIRPNKNTKHEVFRYFLQKRSSHHFAAHFFSVGSWMRFFVSGIWKASAKLQDSSMVGRQNIGLSNGALV